MVNLPVTIIIILTALLGFQLGLGWSISLLLGSGVGWYFWGKLITRWKDWAVSNNVERERLFLLGKIGLLNFSSDKIFDVETEKNE